MKIRHMYLLILFFFPFVVLYAAPEDDDLFSVAGVQFGISEEVYESEDIFFDEVEDEIKEILDQDPEPDLVVFPEYIGVFFQLIEYNDIVSDHKTFSGALGEVLEENPRFKSMDDIFTRSTSVIRYLEGWSEISDRYDLTIVAGSCFVTEEDGALKNRSLVFNPEGMLIYQQDKVFLTDFERDIIGIEPGRIEDAGFFCVDGHRLALTICRDTYSPVWEKKNSGVFLWIDIKANGESYNSVQRRSFMRALPLRMSRTDVNFGMTVCAVGSYLDLFWEGESTAVYKTGTGLTLADISDSCDSEDVIFFNIHAEQ